MLLKQAFGTAEEGIYLYTRTDGKLLSPSRKVKAKTQVKKNSIIRDILFVDDATVAANSPSQLQSYIDHFANAFTTYPLISLKKKS